MLKYNSYLKARSELTLNGVLVDLVLRIVEERFNKYILDFDLNDILNGLQIPKVLLKKCLYVYMDMLFKYSSGLITLNEHHLIDLISYLSF